MVKDVRSDLGKPVDPWFGRQPAGLRETARKLHALILSAVPGLKAELKWGMPCYLKNGMVCGLMGAKRHVGLFFHQGVRLKDPRKLLQGSGRTMRGLKFTSPEEIPATALKAFVKQAAALNESA
ncbi:MAG: DUF1801 domain-containing protein [Planctomycetes bacterium]|nr:DUF1801 domain-containing protein [Planctomycetota bacterium]